MDQVCYTVTEAYGSHAQSKDMSTKKANDWLSQLILDCCTIADWTRYFELFVCGEEIHVYYRDVIKGPYGYVHVQPNGKVRQASGETVDIEKVLAIRPRSVELRLRARLEFQGFEVSFLRDVMDVGSYLSDRRLKATYSGFYHARELNIGNATRLLKGLLDGTRCDFDEALLHCGAVVMHKSGVTYIANEGNVYVSCGLSTHSDILAWFMFFAWFLIVPEGSEPIKSVSFKGETTLLLNPKGGLVTLVDTKMAVHGSGERGCDPHRGKKCVRGLVRGKDLKFNPLVAFRLVRYGCLGY